MKRTRRAAVLIIALVALGVAAMVSLAMLRVIADSRKELRLQTWRAQAGWLAESALDRAAARLARQSDYTGETWKVPADELGGNDAAVVQIRVEPVTDQPARRSIHVVADYPDDPQYRVRESRETVIELPGQ